MASGDLASHKCGSSSGAKQLGWPDDQQNTGGTNDKKNGDGTTGPDNVVRGPWRHTGVGKPSVKTTAWRRGMAGLEEIGATMMAWANAPAESWEQERHEADVLAEQFRIVADAFRRRAEVVVEHLKLDPAVVEPYDDAANHVSGVGDCGMEVVNRIEARYKEHKEDIERGHFGEETVGYFKG